MDENLKKVFPNGIAIAGLRGGSGKTVTSIGIIKALTDKGFSIAPFKKGPDYIDPAWLEKASGNSCHNLDTYLLNSESILSIFTETNENCDIAIIEGNRGLFDGMDIDGTYSFAELVKMLNLPLLLVIDCTKASRTVAAMVMGCQAFDPHLNIAGIILNNVAGDRHGNIIKGSIEKFCNIPVIGSIPKLKHFSFPERHLGLVPVHEYKEPDSLINDLGDVFNEKIDFEHLLKIIEVQKLSTKPESKIIKRKEKISPTDITIGILKDTAFNFYYHENIDAIKSYGANIEIIDSISDTALPAIDGLYIGGGFPETQIEKLSKNTSLMKDIKDAVETGLPVYAECGGLVYLSDSLTVAEKEYPLAGVFPFKFDISKKPVGHGYTCFYIEKENPFFDVGTEIKGHEFRYSRLTNIEESKNISFSFKMLRGNGIIEGSEGAVYKNTLATFMHTHVMSKNTTWIKNLTEIARNYRENHGYVKNSSSQF